MRAPSWFHALVSKDIPRSKWQNIPAAQKATEDERTKLRNPARPTWDESRVAEMNSVRARGKATNTRIHFGRLHDICVEKFSELAEHLRKYKGRVVFGGHDIRDSEGFQILFNDGGSGASFANASKLIDAVSLIPGNDGEQSDAPQAYTQCELGAETAGHNTETWIELPRHVWPKHWHGWHTGS